jgi:hypothetical protein
VSGGFHCEFAPEEFSRRQRLLRLENDLFRILAAEGQMVASNFDLDRIAERGKANELEAGANEEAHFLEAAAVFGREVDFGDGAATADLQGGQGLGGDGHLGDLLAGNLFDENFFGEPLANAKSGVADLADQAGLAAEELDFLFFAEAHFTEAMGDVGWSGKLFDAHIHARLDRAERAEERLRAFFRRLAVVVMRFTHFGIID